MKFRVCSRKFSKKIIDFRFLPIMQSWSISADFRLYDCSASLSSVYYGSMSSVFKDIQKVCFAGCALLIRCRLYTVQFWRISKSVISLDWFLSFFPNCFLSFLFCVQIFSERHLLSFQVLSDQPESADQYEFSVEDGDVILMVRNTVVCTANHCWGSGFGSVCFWASGSASGTGPKCHGSATLQLKTNVCRYSAW